MYAKYILHISIVGSVVECSPATRAARVRFPDDATFFCSIKIFFFFAAHKERCFMFMTCPPYLVFRKGQITNLKHKQLYVGHDHLLPHCSIMNFIKKI